jgi:gentisate 1,2-dioxygenase
MNTLVPGIGTLVLRFLITCNVSRVDWTTGSIFITPPGWWHSHHNDSREEAWVLPIQDAGLYTHQRTLDIRFADDEVAAAEKKAASQTRPKEEFLKSRET